MTDTPLAILETALYADDLDAARAFYGGTLGLEVVTEVAGRHVFFRLAGSMLLVFDPAAASAGPSSGSLPVPAHGAAGPGHACLAVPRAALDGWRAKLEAVGIAIEADFHWPNGARSLYFRDPAGNSLEMAEPGLWGFSEASPGSA